MKIGVDSSVIIAGVHANHPHHEMAAGWLIQNIPLHDLMVAHHSILESYAVLTRLPGELRLNGAEAKQLLESTIRPNMQVAEFHGSSIWDCIDSMLIHSAIGGHSYDVFTAKILYRSGAEAIATFNDRHFATFAPHMSILNPSHRTSR
jgi:predicted nucleic acid-binding protein